MKHIPLYSLVIFPTQDQIALVKSYKQLLRNKIDWFGSANAAAHITVIQFKNEFEFSLYIERIREFCKTVSSEKVRFNSLSDFESAGAFFIAPDSDSKAYLDNLIIAIHQYLGFIVNTQNVNAHMSIGRNIRGERMQAAYKLFETIPIDFEFLCDALYVRKFNDDTNQYSDIVEKIAFGM